MRTKTSDSESKQGAARLTAQTHPATRSEHPLRQMQRTLGNRAVGHLIQAKLRVSQPGDEYEQEADRIAERVVNTPGPDGSTPASASSPPAVHRKCDACASGGGTCSECAAEDSVVQRQALAGSISPLIQRQPNACQIPTAGEEEETSSQPAAEEEPMQSVEEEDSVQRLEEHAHSGAPSIQRSPEGQLFASPDVTQSIESTKGQGQTLPGNVQREFGDKMGADFSQVRIHTDGNAA